MCACVAMAMDSRSLNFHAETLSISLALFESYSWQVHHRVISGVEGKGNRLMRDALIVDPGTSNFLRLTIVVACWLYTKTTLFQSDTMILDASAR